MYRIVYSAKQLDLTKIKNSVAKSVYKKLDGAYSFKKGSTGCQVKTTVLYQIPHYISKRYSLNKEEADTVNVMNIEIQFTVYSNKLRVYLAELSPEEQTIGFKTFNKDVFDNMQNGVQEVLDFIHKIIIKKFEYYDFLF